jgi:hypothetical protein
MNWPWSFRAKAVVAPSVDHEEATIKAFVMQEKQKLFLSFISSPVNRRKFTAELANFRWFDRSFTTSIPWQGNPSLSMFGQQLSGINNLSSQLQSKGARETCWVISGDPQIDGQEMGLNAALECAIDCDSGTILSCIPGKLAYYKGKNESLILAR